MFSNTHHMQTTMGGALHAASLVLVRRSFVCGVMLHLRAISCAPGVVECCVVLCVWLVVMVGVFDDRLFVEGLVMSVCLFAFRVVVVVGSGVDG